jgi:hypothetical protein
VRRLDTAAKSRMRHLFPTLALLLAVLAAQPALAAPPPMSTSELLQKSDLVALIRVLAVTCVSVNKDERTGEELPSYRARAELMEVIKGEEQKGLDVTIAFHAIPEGAAGPWTVYYYPGEMVWTHLVGKDGVYTTTWWNGRGTLVSKAIITELPTTQGATVEVPRRNAQTRD